MAEKKPEPVEVRPRILRAFKPGDIVFLECVRPITADALEHIHAQFKRMVPDVRVIVLPYGTCVVAREEEKPTAATPEQA